MRFFIALTTSLFLPALVQPLSAQTLEMNSSMRASCAEIEGRVDPTCSRIRLETGEWPGAPASPMPDAVVLTVDRSEWNTEELSPRLSSDREWRERELTPVGATVTPEPGTVLLLATGLLGLLGFGFVRRRRASGEIDIG